MAGMGPPPNPKARRRNARPAAMVLPKAGRKGAAPRWPLKGCSPAERGLWQQLWRTPQAYAWERLGYTREVALYVRLQVMAEAGSLDAMKEARQRSDRLGLSPLAMLRLQWEISDQVVDEPGATGASSAPAAAGDATVTDMRERRSRRARLTG